MKVVHLNMYDTVPWCEDPDVCSKGDDIEGWDSPGEPEEANCLPCLDAVAAYAARVAARRRTLQAPSWPTSHESDCPAVAGGACRCPLGNL